MAYGWLHALSGMCARMAGTAVMPGLLRVERAAAVDGHAAEEVPRRLPLHPGRCLGCVICAIKRLRVVIPAQPHVCGPTALTQYVALVWYLGQECCF